MPFRLLEDETRAARERSPELLRAAIVMGRRLDVTPAAFGFVFEVTTEGPRYGFESVWTDEEFALGPEELERRWIQRHGLEDS